MNDSDKLPKGKYDPVKILSTGDSFFKAAERCNEQRPIPTGNFEWLLVPMIVNRTLSCELFIKAILLYHGKASSGHDLCALWDQLPQEVQSKIKQVCHYNQDSIFVNKLAEIALAFKEWRYVYEYEKGTIDIQFLEILATALKEVSHEIVKYPITSNT